MCERNGEKLQSGIYLFFYILNINIFTTSLNVNITNDLVFFTTENKCRP